MYREGSLPTAKRGTPSPPPTPPLQKIKSN